MVNSKRDLKALEERRLKGARLLKRGVTQAEVSRQLGVSRQAVSKWARQLSQDNGEVLKLKAKPLGRPYQLDEVQRKSLSRMIAKGAAAAGFPSDMWTLKRVQRLVKREFGVNYSLVGVWRIMRTIGYKSRTTKDEIQHINTLSTNTMVAAAVNLA